MFLNCDVGKMIFTLRTERGLSQERLSEGLCTMGTISRIENGVHMPTRELFQALLERLGEPGFFHAYYLNSRFYEEMFVKGRLIFALENEDEEGAKSWFYKYLEVYDGDNPCSVAFLEYIKIFIWSEAFPVEPGLIERIENILKLTHSNFSLERGLSGYLFDNTEFLILNTLAGIYLKAEMVGEALNTLGSLVEKTGECRHFLPFFYKMRATLYNNAAIILLREGRFYEGIKILGLALRDCERAGGFVLLAKILRTRIFLNLRIRQRESARTDYFRIKELMMGIRGFCKADLNRFMVSKKFLLFW